MAHNAIGVILPRVYCYAVYRLFCVSGIFTPSERELMLRSYLDNRMTVRTDITAADCAKTRKGECGGDGNTAGYQTRQAVRKLIPD